MSLGSPIGAVKLFTPNAILGELGTLINKYSFLLLLLLRHSDHHGALIVKPTDYISGT
jgi:hypothetical protein